MEQERLELLKADLYAQAQRIEKVYQKIEERIKGKDDPIVLESLSYQLHNLYCSYEDLFKVVADFFENRIEERAYHTQLLHRMAIEIKGLRPRLLSDNALQLLDELRAFRHLFRHAYLYQLDPRRVELVLEKALELKELFKEDLERFINEIRG